uniref:Sushi domain-containing protein n=1 Tax=Gouania willdenowi TaxID=441366 RepID=A0A8C5DZS7_GOUWI
MIFLLVKPWSSSTHFYKDTHLLPLHPHPFTSAYEHFIFFSSLVAPGACGKPPTIDDGIILAGIKEQYAENDQVTYGCPLYYTIEGGPYKTCINGEWIGEIRCNKPCIVDRDAMNRQNIEFKYSRHDRIYSGHNDMIEFRCKRGTKVGPVSMRQRCVDGVIDLPTCSGR